MINKAQGQEYEKVLSDAREQPFIHGHTYVALSRIRYCKTIATCIYQDRFLEDGPIIDNVVYKELLLNT